MSFIGIKIEKKHKLNDESIHLSEFKRMPLAEYRIKTNAREPKWSEERLLLYQAPNIEMAETF
jgi:hypothetical protein